METIMLQATAAAPQDYTMILMMVAVFAVMYFFMIRPQQKKQKEITKWRDALQKGDKVLTAGGVYGIIKATEGSIVHLEISRDVEIKIDRGFLMRDPSDIQKK